MAVPEVDGLVRSVRVGGVSAADHETVIGEFEGAWPAGFANRSPADRGS